MPATTENSGRASSRLPASDAVTARSDAGRASDGLPARRVLTAPAELIDDIRMLYRLAKTNEQTRIRIDHGLTSYARVYLSEWDPGADAKVRKRNADIARLAVEAVRKDIVIDLETGQRILGPRTCSATLSEIYDAIAAMVLSTEPARAAFEAQRAEHEKAARKGARSLPAWQRLAPIRGFSEWGLVAILGEAGDISNYTGCRHLFKRLGLAPDECYPTGERRTGRKIPRNTRGRVMGIIADPLLRAQWQGAEKIVATEMFGVAKAGLNTEQRKAVAEEIQRRRAESDEPGMPAGPYGAVYAQAKARQLASGKTKGHADKSARRAMIKALIHDVHRAWWDKELDYQ